MTPKSKYPISLIFPVYNEEKVIADTVKHYLPYKEKFNLEIIIADDSSTDQTLDRVEGLADKIILNSSGKRSRSANCNRGASHSIGEVLIILDADIRIENPAEFFSILLSVFNGNDTWVGGMINHRVYPDEEIFSDRITHALWNWVMRGVTCFNFGISTPGFQLATKEAYWKIGGFDETIGLLATYAG